VIGALLNGLINPLIAAVFGKPSLDAVGTFTINHAHFSIGLVLTAVINFVIIAAVLYLVVVAPMNALAARRERGQGPEEHAMTDEARLLTEIRDTLRAQNP